MKHISLLVLVLLANFLFAQEHRYAASFGIGSWSTGSEHGGTGVASNGRVTDPFWNPAGIVMVDRLQTGSMYANLYNKLEQQSYLGFVLPLMKNSFLRSHGCDSVLMRFPAMNLMKIVQ